MGNKTIIDVTNPTSYFSENTGTLNLYLKDIRKYDILSAEEEHELCKRIKEGDEEAKETLIKSNLRFVLAVAKRFNTSDNLQDLIQIGNLGLMQAIEKFDCYRTGEDGKPLRFLSYAVHYIRREIAFYLLNNGLIRRTNNIKTTLKTNHIKNRFYLQNGRVPTVEEIADIIKEEYGIEVKDLSYLYDVDTKHLESPAGDDSKETYGNSAAYNEKSASYNEYNKVIDEEENNFMLSKLLPCLDEREKTIITGLYGVKMDRPLTMEELGDELNISKERVRQIRNTALKKLRKFAHEHAALK